MNEIRKTLKKLGVSLEQLVSIKEMVKEKRYNRYGYFPSKAEGCCVKVSRELAKIIKGTIRGGWFTTDTPCSEENVEIETSFGVQQLCDINEEDSRKLSHWWLEIKIKTQKTLKEYIIDLTAEQFNEFLEKPIMKEIEIIPKDSKKAERYETLWTLPAI